MQELGPAGGTLFTLAFTLALCLGCGGRSLPASTANDGAVMTGLDAMTAAEAAEAGLDAPEPLPSCSEAVEAITARCPGIDGARVQATLCPAITPCRARCLADTPSCSNISCALCAACDCEDGKYGQCISSCAGQ